MHTIKFNKHSGIYSLKTTQRVNVPVDIAWMFFSNPLNLEVITPEELDFEITNDPDDVLFSGQIITYTLKLFPFIRTNWVTEIKDVVPLRSFVDEQRFGPYAFWHHRHDFERRGNDTLMTDEVFFKPPGGIVGRIAYKWYIRKKLDHIFSHRARRIEEIFDENELDAYEPEMRVVKM